MNIYQIYITIVNLGSFSAAAKKLHRSPSSISKKMSLLEERLNVQLFDRTTRHLSVTEAGKLYYTQCLKIASQIEAAERELTGLSNTPSGTISLTWPNALSTSSVIKTLSEFNKCYPLVNLDVQVDNDHVNLIDEKIDFAFRLNPNIESNMIAIELFKITPIICAGRSYVERYGLPTSFEELADRPLLLLNFSVTIQKFWRSLPGMKGLDPDAHHRVNDINALYSMARKGFGATMLFHHMIEQDLADESLIRLLPNAPFPGLPVYLMYHKSSFVPEKVRVFIDFFKHHYLGTDHS